MTLTAWAGVLFFMAIVLLIAELLLPTHGILGVLGVGCILGAIGVCFGINVWLGVCALIASAIATPAVGAMAVQLWPRTPIGKRLVLPPVSDAPRAAPVAVGETGRSISELRPMGICEFESQRIEAMSEVGVIPPGKNVKVVALAANRPIVRAI